MRFLISIFSITLVKPSDPAYLALSNMPVKKEKPDSPVPGCTEVIFEKTVPMVTYLAIFVVCDFVFIEAKPGATKAKIPIKASTC